MALEVLQQLIDKKDNFEIVRDQIAAILKLEIENQKQLAAAAGKTASDWDLKIFMERSNPFEEFQSENYTGPAIVNVWYESSDFDDAGSDTIERQKTTATYNVDVYSYGTAQETSEGHTPGDLASSLRLAAAVRLVRNILMAGPNTYLRFKRPFIWRRRVETINIYQPNAEDTTIQNIIGARLVFRVTFNEHSPQYEGAPLSELSVKVIRSETGEVLLETEYHYDGN